MRQSKELSTAELKRFQPIGGGNIEVVNLPEYVERRADMGLFGSVVVARYYNRRYPMFNRQPVKLPGGGSHYAVERPYGMEQVAGVKTDIGFDLDYPIDRFDKAGDYVFLALGQSAGRAATVVLPRSKMAV
jgi:hypothetical protein